MLCQLLRHPGGGGSFFLLQQRVLLSLMPNRQCGEVRQHSHHLSIVLVECRRTTMRHDEDSSSRILHLPWKENAIGHERRFDPHNVEETLPDSEELWPAALQTDAASARIARKHRVQEFVI